MSLESEQTPEVDWQELCAITCRGVLDQVPEEAGLYRLTFTLSGSEYTYIGEAGNLRRRIREYAHSPTRGNDMEHFLFDLLNDCKQAQLAISCAGLNDSKLRRVRETLAIADARQQGTKCLNKGESEDVNMLRFRLLSRERMLLRDLERVRVRLAALGKSAASESTS